MSSNEVNESSNGEVAVESKPNEYVSTLVKEKYALDSESHPNAMKLIDNGKYSIFLHLNQYYYFILPKNCVTNGIRTNNVMK